MAPKKKQPPVQEAPPVEEPDDQPQEEEEEGPGRAAFHLSVEQVTNLPCELETILHFSGLCRSNKSEPAAASKAPSSWELKKAKFIRTCGQELYDDLVDRELVVRLRDAAGDAVIGEAALGLRPLLHERTEVSGELELKLTPEYHRKWFPDAEPEEQETKPARGKTPKGKAEPKAEPKAAERQASTAEGTGEGGSKPATPFEPPATRIRLAVRVEELVAPAEDRGSWTTLTLGVAGVFALPERLSTLGITGPEDVDQHPLRYRGALLGEALGEGLLCKPAKPLQAEPSDGAAVEAGEAPPAVAELSEAEWREQCEQHGFSVRFKGGERISRYRGAAFVRDFRRMLNEVGGVWFHFLPEERPPTDPKKTNPPEVAGLVAHYQGRAWFDLRALIRSGVTSAQARCPLRALERAPAAASSSPPPSAEPPPSAGAPSLESAHTYVHLSLELSHDLTLPEHPSLQVDVDTLLPQHLGFNKFPDSGIAEKMYCEAVERAIEVMCQDCAGSSKGGVPGVLEALKRSGNHAEIKEHLRRTIVAVLRERLRKDTSIVPGRPVDPTARGELLAGTYAHLTGTMARVVDELRRQHPAPDVPEPDRRSEPASPPAQRTRLGSKELLRMGSKAVREEMSPQQLRKALSSKDAPRISAARSDFGGSQPDGEGSPCGSVELQAAQPGSQLAAALAEGAAATRARKVLSAAHDEGERYSRLAFEAEMVGRFDRAARLIQNRLLLEEFRHDPKEWIAYAKFCARARGRQAAAEEALRQAVRLLWEGAAPHSKETAMEVDLMLASLLLDRGRHDEAIRVFRVWHEKDLADPCCNFLLGLALFLAGDPEAAAPLLEAVAKPREWFQGLQDGAEVEARLNERRATDGPLDPRPYASCLERLLEFGLPSLAFTFIDQCGTLPEEELAREPIALMDARALAVDRDFAACSARLERLLAQGGASREAWRLAGECYLRLQEVDRALQAFNNAMAFEQKFDDPVVYVHLGSVLLAKKRWKQASSMFLRSMHFRPTAEAWSGVAYAEYRADELKDCYEALCEANMLDNERPDVWAQLTLVHLRLENWESADNCFRQCLAHSPDCEELLLDVAAEYTRRDRQPSFAEAATRRALELKSSGMGHSCLADALAAQGQWADAAHEARMALVALAHSPEMRKPIYERALKWCEELGDTDFGLSDALHEAQQLADEELQRLGSLQ